MLRTNRVQQIRLELPMERRLQPENSPDHTPPSRGSAAVAAVSLRHAVLYPSLYCWFILVGTLDILITWIILHAGGREINTIAAKAIELGNKWGIVSLKFLTVVVFVLACERIGRSRAKLGRRLAIAAVAISAAPPVLGILQLIASGRTVFF
jgi:hypothetical protein